MLDGIIAIYHFTDKDILSIYQKKYNSISKYNNFIEIFNKIYLVDLVHAMTIFFKKKDNKKIQCSTNTSTRKIYVTFVYKYAGGLKKTSVLYNIYYKL
jgi:hypothetical protein